MADHSSIKKPIPVSSYSLDPELSHPNYEHSQHPHSSQAVYVDDIANDDPVGHAYIEVATTITPSIDRFGRRNSLPSHTNIPSGATFAQPTQSLEHSTVPAQPSTTDEDIDYPNRSSDPDECIQPSQQSSQQLSQQPSQQAVQQPSQQAVQQPSQQAVQQPSQQPLQQPSQPPQQQQQQQSLPATLSSDDINNHPNNTMTDYAKKLLELSSTAAKAQDEVDHVRLKRLGITQETYDPIPQANGQFTPRNTAPDQLKLGPYLSIAAKDYYNHMFQKYNGNLIPFLTVVALCWTLLFAYDMITLLPSLSSTLNTSQRDPKIMVGLVAALRAAGIIVVFFATIIATFTWVFGSTYLSNERSRWVQNFHKQSRPQLQNVKLDPILDLHQDAYTIARLESEQGYILFSSPYQHEDDGELDRNDSSYHRQRDRRSRTQRLNTGHLKVNNYEDITSQHSQFYNPKEDNKHMLLEIYAQDALHGEAHRNVIPTLQTFELAEKNLDINSHYSALGINPKQRYQEILKLYTIQDEQVSPSGESTSFKYTNSFDGIRTPGYDNRGFNISSTLEGIAESSPQEDDDDQVNGDPYVSHTFIRQHPQHHQQHQKHQQQLQQHQQQQSAPSAQLDPPSAPNQPSTSNSSHKPHHRRTDDIIPHQQVAPTHTNQQHPLAQTTIQIAAHPLQSADIDQMSGDDQNPPQQELQPNKFSFDPTSPLSHAAQLRLNQSKHRRTPSSSLYGDLEDDNRLNALDQSLANFDGASHQSQTGPLPPPPHLPNSSNTPLPHHQQYYYYNHQRQPQTLMGSRASTRNLLQTGPSTRNLLVGVTQSHQQQVENELKRVVATVRFAHQPQPPSHLSSFLSYILCCLQPRVHKKLHVSPSLNPDTKQSHKNLLRQLIEYILEKKFLTEHVIITATNILIILHTVICYLTKTLDLIQNVVPIIFFSFLTLAFSHVHWNQLAIQTIVVAAVHVTLFALQISDLSPFAIPSVEAEISAQVLRPASTWDGLLLLAAIVICYMYQIYATHFIIKPETHVSFYLTHGLEQNEKTYFSIVKQLLPTTLIAKYKQNTNLSIWQRHTSVTIMFIYINKFDLIASKKNAQELVVLLNNVFSSIDVLTHFYKTWGAYKIETVGEVYMISAGSPYEQPFHADVMCDLALDISKSLSTLFRQLELKIGINSGPIVAGIIGIHYPRYRVIGDTVNTSSRMSSTTKAGTIQLSSSTMRRICTPLESILWEYSEGLAVQDAKITKAKLYKKLGELREKRQYYELTAQLEERNRQPTRRKFVRKKAREEHHQTDIEMGVLGGDPGYLVPTMEDNAQGNLQPGTTPVRRILTPLHRIPTINETTHSSQQLNFSGGSDAPSQEKYAPEGDYVNHRKSNSALVAGYNSNMSFSQKQLVSLLKEKMYKKHIEKYNHRLTYTAVDSKHFIVESLGIKEVKGKGKMSTWQLVGRHYGSVRRYEPCPQTMDNRDSDVDDSDDEVVALELLDVDDNLKIETKFDPEHFMAPGVTPDTFLLGNDAFALASPIDIPPISSQLRWGSSGEDSNSALLSTPVVPRPSSAAAISADAVSVQSSKHPSPGTNALTQLSDEILSLGEDNNADDFDFQHLNTGVNATLSSAPGGSNLQAKIHPSFMDSTSSIQAAANRQLTQLQRLANKVGYGENPIHPHDVELGLTRVEVPTLQRSNSAGLRLSDKSISPALNILPNQITPLQNNPRPLERRATTVTTTAGPGFFKTPPGVRRRNSTSQDTMNLIEQQHIQAHLNSGRHIHPHGAVSQADSTEHNPPFAIEGESHFGIANVANPNRPTAATGASQPYDIDHASSVHGTDRLSTAAASQHAKAHLFQDGTAHSLDGYSIHNSSDDAHSIDDSLSTHSSSEQIRVPAIGIPANATYGGVSSAMSVHPHIGPGANNPHHQRVMMGILSAGGSIPQVPQLMMADDDDGFLHNYKKAFPMTSRNQQRQTRHTLGPTDQLKQTPMFHKQSIPFSNVLPTVAAEIDQYYDESDESSFEDDSLERDNSDDNLVSYWENWASFAGAHILNFDQLVDDKRRLYDELKKSRIDQQPDPTHPVATTTPSDKPTSTLSGAIPLSPVPPALQLQSASPVSEDKAITADARAQVAVGASVLVSATTTILPPQPDENQDTALDMADMADMADIALQSELAKLSDILGESLETFLSKEKTHSDDELIDNATNVQSYYMRGNETNLFLYPTNPTAVISPFTLEFYTGRPNHRLRLSNIFCRTLYTHRNGTDARDDIDDDLIVQNVSDDEDYVSDDDDDDDDHNGYILPCFRPPNAQERAVIRKKERLWHMQKQRKEQHRLERSTDNSEDDDYDDGGMMNHGKNKRLDEDDNKPEISITWNQHPHEHQHENQHVGAAQRQFRGSVAPTFAAPSERSDHLAQPTNPNAQPFQTTGVPPHRKRFNVHLPKPLLQQDGTPTFAMSSAMVNALEAGYNQDLISSTWLSLWWLTFSAIFVFLLIILPYAIELQHQHTVTITLSKVSPTVVTGWRLLGTIISASVASIVWVIPLVFLGAITRFRYFIRGPLICPDPSRTKAPTPSVERLYQIWDKISHKITQQDLPTPPNDDPDAWVEGTGVWYDYFKELLRLHYFGRLGDETALRYSVDLNIAFYYLVLTCFFILPHVLLLLLWFVGIHTTSVGCIAFYLTLFAISVYTFIPFKLTSLWTLTSFILGVVLTIVGTDESTRAKTWYIVMSGFMSALILFQNYLITKNRRVQYIESLHLYHDHTQSLTLFEKLLPLEILSTLDKRLPGVQSAMTSSKHRFATILFADVVNFTVMSAQLQSEELVLFLNMMFSVFDQLSSARGVYKVETIGDCYFACTNVVQSVRPQHVEPNTYLSPHDHAENMVYFAMDIIFYLSLLPHPLASKESRQVRTKVLRGIFRALHRKSQRKETWNVFLQNETQQKSNAFALAKVAARQRAASVKPVMLRVGIHTGDVVAGVVGRTSPRYHLFGSSVTISQKMESSGYPGRISISSTTRNFLSPKWSVVYKKTLILERDNQGPAQHAVSKLTKKIIHDLPVNPELLTRSTPRHNTGNGHRTLNSGLVAARNGPGIGSNITLGPTEFVGLTQLQLTGSGAADRASMVLLGTAPTQPAPINYHNSTARRKSLALMGTGSPDEGLTSLIPYPEEDGNVTSPGSDEFIFATVKGGGPETPRSPFSSPSAKHRRSNRLDSPGFSTSGPPDELDFLNFLRSTPEQRSPRVGPWISTDPNLIKPGTPLNAAAPEGIFSPLLPNDPIEERIRYMELFMIRGHEDIQSDLWFPEDDLQVWPSQAKAKPNHRYW